jgi:hypothetical protein
MSATPQETSPYAELMLFLTDNGDAFAIRCHQDKKGVYWYCASEFIANVFKHAISQEDAESVYVNILCNQPHDRSLLMPIDIQFLGPFERPKSCVRIQGISIIYHYLDKIGKIILKQKAKFDKTLLDCLNGNESKYVRMFDDGQLVKMYKEYEAGLLVGEFLNRRPTTLNCSMAFDYAKYYSDETAYLMTAPVLKRVFKNKMDELKTMKDSQDAEVEKVKLELRKVVQLLKEKEAQTETVMSTNEALQKKLCELQLEVQQEERRKKQKGEAFSLRELVEGMKISITNGQFNLLSQRISAVMREKYPDRHTFSKQKIIHYYPDDKSLLEVLVTREMVDVSMQA